MGYYTDFKLEIKDSSVDVDNVLEELQSISGYRFYIKDGRIESYDVIKWYDHILDMRNISMKFPNVLFYLYGNGEDEGDMWLEYYLNGSYQRAKTIIAYSELLPNAWE
jgi:hypothetical protein